MEEYTDAAVLLSAIITQWEDAIVRWEQEILDNEFRSLWVDLGGEA